MLVIRRRLLLIFWNKEMRIVFIEIAQWKLENFESNETSKMVILKEES